MKENLILLFIIVYNLADNKTMDTETIKSKTYILLNVIQSYQEAYDLGSYDKKLGISDRVVGNTLR